MATVPAPKKELPAAVIRAFEPESDLKIARFLIGSSIMEPAAQANKSALFTPMILMLWVLFTNTLVERYVGGWPDSVYNLFSGRGFEDWVLENWSVGMLQWLKLAPVLVAPPIVLLAFFELRHRNKFEDEMTRAIGDEDLRGIKEYYQDNKATGAGRSGFWVLEFDSRIIGTFALDGMKPTVCLDSTVDHEMITKKKEDTPAEIATAVVEKDERYALRNRSAKATAVVTASSSSAIIEPSTYTDTLHLRRFATSLSFRPTGIEDDFLEFAAKFAFSPSPTSPPPAAKIVIAVRPAVQEPFVATLLKAGYKPASTVPGTPTVDMDSWRKRALPKGRTIVPLTDKLLNPIWPLNLEWVTFVLTKEDWLARA